MMFCLSSPIQENWKDSAKSRFHDFDNYDIDEEDTQMDVIVQLHGMCTIRRLSVSPGLAWRNILLET